MIKVSVMYPKTEDSTFDMEYYKTAHMDIVRNGMKPLRIEIDQAVDGPYMAIGHLYFDSLEALGASPDGAAAAAADVPNFSNVESVMQISEVVE